MKRMFGKAQQNTNAMFSDMAFSAYSTENKNFSDTIIEDTSFAVSSFLVIPVAGVINLVVRLAVLPIIKKQNGMAYKKLLLTQSI